MAWRLQTGLCVAYKLGGAEWMSATKATASRVQLFHDNRQQWEGVVGLEIHAQINSKSKLFCRSPVQHAAATNTCVGLFDSAHPGTLPSLNKSCVEAAIMSALAFDATINPVSYFDRKHYFYPDLPAGYQITQQRVPVAERGTVTFLVTPATGLPYVMDADLLRIQLEEDSGKSVHCSHSNKVLVDLNRAGVGLLELVFGPCLRSACEAGALARHVAHTLRLLGVCTARMNEGALRVDANVSVHSPGQPLGIRTEVKNINSFKFVEEAVQYEVDRQVALLEAGGRVINETRNYDPDSRTTRAMRDKEGLQDYRFLPEPNLPPLRVFDSSSAPLPSSSCVDVAALRKRLPPLPRPNAHTLHFLMEAGTSVWDARQLMYDPPLYDFFISVLDVPAAAEDAMDDGVPAIAAHLLLRGACAAAARTAGDPLSWPLQPGHVACVSRLQRQLLLTPERARDAVTALVAGDSRDPTQLCREEGWLLSTDVEAARAAALQAIGEQPELVSKFARTASNPKKQQRPFKKLTKQTLLLLPSNVDVNKVEAVLREELLAVLPCHTDSEGS